MFELSWFLWYIVLNTYFMIFNELNERCKTFYYKYLDKYFLPDLSFNSSAFFGIIFRIYLFYLIYDDLIIQEQNWIFVPIILSNTIIIIIDCKILYDVFLKRNEILLKVSLYPANVTEFIIIMETIRNSDKLYMIHKAYIYVLLSIFIALFFFGLFLKLSVHFDPVQNRTNNSTKNIIDVAYEIKIVQEGMFKDQVCSICLEDYETNSQYYLLECGHYAHPDCLHIFWKKYGHNRCFYNFCGKSNL